MNIIIFGITGDLARKKLVPTLSKFKKKVKVIGVGRKLRADINLPNWIDYIQGNFDDKTLYTNLAQIKGSKLFYLAIPPDLYQIVLKNLKLGRGDKLLLEKPFGEDLKSAKKLNKSLLSKFKESQIYRVDHYLGKKGLKNLKIKRWKPARAGGDIEKIEIRILEKEGVNNRGVFYDKLGALKDVGQNHLLATLSLLTKQKADILKLVEAEHGQYRGFREEKGIDPKSKTETYFKILVLWKGVSIVLESGKKMMENVGEVKIYYKNKKQPKILKIESGGYDQVFAKAIKGDKSIFPNADQIFAQWKFTEKVVAKLKKVPLRQYA